jgi:hypothetical protein
MPTRFAQRFWGVLCFTLLIGLFLFSFWKPERQIQRHTSNLLKTVEQEQWADLANFIGKDYQDQWGDDRVLLLERMRDVFRSVRTVRITAVDANITTENRHGFWRAKITINGDGGEVMTLIKERINSLSAPFELEWRRMSAKPWDWKLVRVSNSSLEISEAFQ